MFLDKTLYFLSASLHPGVLMSTSEFNAVGKPCVNWHPVQDEKYSQWLHAAKTRISSGQMDHLAFMHADIAPFFLFMHTKVKLLFLVNFLFSAPPPPLPLRINKDDVSATTITISLTPSSDSNGEVM